MKDPVLKKIEEDFDAVEKELLSLRKTVKNFSLLCIVCMIGILITSGGITWMFWEYRHEMYELYLDVLVIIEELVGVYDNAY